MTKAKSKKQKKSEKKASSSVTSLDSQDLGNSKLVSETLLDYIRTGDLDAFRSVLAGHIMNTNKVQLSKQTGINRRTLYDILDPERNFNPALTTVSAIIRGLAKC